MRKVFSHHGRPSHPSPQETDRDGSVSIIAADVHIEGQLTTAGTIQIEGTVVGDVASESQVYVAPGGTVHGDLRAPEIVVGGKVKGSLVASRRAILRSTSVIDGDITATKLEVQEGGQVNGLLQTGTTDTQSTRGDSESEGAPMHEIPVSRVADAG